jgi:hypothetical protein
LFVLLGVVATGFHCRESLSFQHEFFLHLSLVLFFNTVPSCLVWLLSMSMSMIDPRTLTDAALIEAVGRLTRVSRETTAELLAHLVVLEERNLHLACGFSSLFIYCRQVLHYSEAEAYDRQQAAHAARRFPVVLAMLAGGQLHLTAVRLLAPHLEDGDHLALLGGAIRKSAQDVRELLARRFPRPDVVASVRRLPTRRGADARTGPTDAPATVSADTQNEGEASSGESAPPLSAGGAEGESAASAPSSVQPQRPAPVPRRTVEPLAPGRHLFKFTGDDETVALLREAQELLSHSLPDGDVAAIVKRGLTMVVEEARRVRHAATRRAREAKSPAVASANDEDPTTRHIHAAVQRLAWERDGGQCAFVGENGWRCEERRFLEYHHLRPWIVGGPPSVENIALRCRAHNQYEAKVYFAPIRDGLAEASRG